MSGWRSPHVGAHLIEKSTILIYLLDSPISFCKPRPALRRSSSGRFHTHGHFHPFVIPFSQNTFTMLLERCKISKRILDLKEHRSSAGYSSVVEAEIDPSDPSTRIYSKWYQIAVDRRI